MAATGCQLQNVTAFRPISACPRLMARAAGESQLNRNMVLQNSVLFGSVNANRHHYELAAEALAQADPGWLADLITRQEPLGQWAYAYTRRPDDIKTILSFADESP